MGFFDFIKDIGHEIKDAAGGVLGGAKDLIGGVAGAGMNMFNRANDRIDRITNAGINVGESVGKGIGGLAGGLGSIVQYLPLIIIVGGGAFVIYQIKRSLK